MAFLGEGERPRDELEPVRKTPIAPSEQERSHAELVAAFRQAIRLKRQEGSNPKWPELGGRAQDYSSARIIRNELCGQTENQLYRTSYQVEQDKRDFFENVSGSEESRQYWHNEEEKSRRAEFYAPILTAWDAIAFEHYVDAKGRAEEFERYYAVTEVGVHCERTGQTAIILSEPQRRILEALADAAEIPYEKGHAEVAIPETMRREYASRGRTLETRDG
jgi:hypothetical protein